MTAMVIIAAGYQPLRVRVTSRANDVMNARAVGVEAVPSERVVCDGRHRPQIRQRAPKPGAGGHMCCIKRPRLAAEEPFGEITCTPQIEVAHLRPLNADDAKEMPRRNVERASLARRHDRFV